jgi:hypothetical protein
MTSLSRQQIDDLDMVARYLADKLSDSEREVFEAYFLEHREVLQELNQTARFKSGLIDLDRSGTLKKLMRPREWWRQPRMIAIAASLVFAVMAGGLWLRNQNSTPTLLAISIDPAMPLAGSLSIQRTRSSSYDATIEIPKQSAAIKLRIRPDTGALPSQYRVAIGFFGTNDAVKSLSEVRGAKASADGFVEVYLDASKLSPAIYEIKISGDGGSNAANAPSSFLVEAVDEHKQ